MDNDRQHPDCVTWLEEGTIGRRIQQLDCVGNWTLRWATAQAFAHCKNILPPRPSLCAGLQLLPDRCLLCSRLDIWIVRIGDANVLFGPSMSALK
jgi:hypothetical protein